jgi:hypothetical protein
MANWEADESAIISYNVHRDYNRNLDNVKIFIDNYYKIDQERKPRMQLIQCLDGIHFYLLISRNFFITDPIGNFATSINLSQNYSEYRFEFRKVWLDYKSMENQIEGTLQAHQSIKNEKTCQGSLE